MDVTGIPIGIAIGFAIGFDAGKKQKNTAERSYSGVLGRMQYNIVSGSQKGFMQKTSFIAKLSCFCFYDDKCYNTCNYRHYIKTSSY